MKIFTKEEIKKLWAPFILIFLISSLVINWNSISWVFNRHVIAGTISKFFYDDFYNSGDNQRMLLDSIGGTSMASDNELDNEKEKFVESTYSNKEDRVEIPAIGISSPLIFTKNSDKDYIFRLLNKGLVLFPKSTLPGQNGQTIILGHSALRRWPKTNHIWVFTYLNEVKKGDKVFIYFHHRKYTYEVERKIFLKRGEKISKYKLENHKSWVTLVSCWPPGRDIKRIAVQAFFLE